MSIKCIIPLKETIDIKVIPNTTLSQTIWLQIASHPKALCSAMGNCGRCRVKFLTNIPAITEKDASLLEKKMLVEGWRLACQLKAEDFDGCVIELPYDSNSSEENSHRDMPKSKMSLHEEKSLLAVDLGTTFIQWKMLSLSGEVLAEGKDLNPQIGAGADVVSRLCMSMQPSGNDILGRLVRARIADIVDSSFFSCCEICLSANTAMTDIFLGYDVTHLCSAPYKLIHHGNCLISSLGDGALRKGNLPPIYIPPVLAPFVGADVSSGVLAVEHDLTPEYPWLLVDMGTNCEFALCLSPDDILLTSVPLGPALEGIGLRLGSVAGADTAVSFKLRPTGIEPCTPSGLPATGISATGYLSLLHILLNIGLVDRNGHFLHDSRNILARRIEKTGFCEANSLLRCTQSLYITADDIEEILKVKAAFSLAMDELFAEAGLTSSDLHGIMLAGSLGKFVDTSDLEALGFLKCGQASKIHVLGNTSLRGAELLLLKPQLRDKLAKRCAHKSVLSMTERNDFMNRFLNYMYLG